MEQTIYFVYLLTFANGKAYVGMSKTDKRGLFTLRYNNHADAAKKGNPLPIYHAWRKHGAPVQEILSKHATREECALAEINEIAARQACDPRHGYNLMHGGQDAWRASEKNRANCVAMAQKSAKACSKKVRDKETGKVYASQREMARALGISESVISLRVKAGEIDRV